MNKLYRVIFRLNRALRGMRARYYAFQEKRADRRGLTALAVAHRMNFATIMAHLEARPCYAVVRRPRQ